MKQSRAGVVAAVITALIMFAVVGGCTAAKRKATPAPSSSASSTIAIPTEPVPPTPSTLPTYVQYSVPASVANDDAKRKQVQLDSCSSTGTGATAAGTIHNSGTKSQSYGITVFFTSDSATAVNYATTSVKVDGGKSAAFTAQRAFSAPAKVLCVLVGVS